jgi:hypothetical protein
MDNQKWSTADEVGKKISVSAMTIKRWCKSYDDYIDYRQEAKGKYYISTNSLEVFKQINKLRKRNLEQQEIIKRLDTQGFSKIITVEEPEQEINNELNNQMTMPAVPLEVIAITKEELKEMIATEIQKVEQYHEQQREKLKTELKEEIHKNNNKLLKRIDERDKLLLETFRSIQQVAAEKKKKKWQFWR